MCDSTWGFLWNFAVRTSNRGIRLCTNRASSPEDIEIFPDISIRWPFLTKFLLRPKGLSFPTWANNCFLGLRWILQQAPFPLSNFWTFYGTLRSVWPLRSYRIGWLYPKWRRSFWSCLVLLELPVRMALKSLATHLNPLQLWLAQLGTKEKCVFWND